MVFNKSLFHNAKEKIIQTSINNEDDDLGCPVPISIDVNETVFPSELKGRNGWRISNSHGYWRRAEMSGNPNDEHRNINKGDNKSRSPL